MELSSIARREFSAFFNRTIRKLGSLEISSRYLNQHRLRNASPRTITIGSRRIVVLKLPRTMVSQGAVSDSKLLNRTWCRKASCARE